MRGLGRREFEAMPFSADPLGVKRPNVEATIEHKYVRQAVGMKFEIPRKNAEDVSSYGMYLLCLRDSRCKLRMPRLSSQVLLEENRCGHANAR